MNDALLSGVFSLLAIIVGGLLGYLVAHKGRNEELCISLIKEYENVVQELCVILDELLTLSTMPKHYSANQCKDIDNALEKFFFKYYIILPQPVLEEIYCLHGCLQYQGAYSFVIKRRKKCQCCRNVHLLRISRHCLVMLL